MYLFSFYTFRTAFSTELQITAHPLQQIPIDCSSPVMTTTQADSMAKECCIVHQLPTHFRI